LQIYLFAALLVVALIWDVAGSWFAQLEALTFPSTPGVITRNEGAEPFEQKIEYAYSVGGAAFRGRGLRRDETWMPWRAEDDERAKNYPVGQRVAVYYKPSDPQDSLLEPGLTWDFAEDLAGAFFTGVMVLGPPLIGIGGLLCRLCTRVRCSRLGTSKRGGGAFSERGAAAAASSG
jgi:hypothetical protein